MIVEKISKVVSYSLLFVSIVAYSAGKELIGDFVFKGMLLLFCISAVISLVRKSYREVTWSELCQLAVGFVYLVSFYFFALLSDVTSKNHYHVILLEAALFLLLGYWMLRAFYENRERLKIRKWSFQKTRIPLAAVAIISFIMIFFQAKVMYRWDSLDYAQQVVSMASQFDFTLSCLQNINRIHISMGFAAVYEYAYFVFLGNANLLIWVNLLLGILTEICIYQILKTLYPQKKRIVLVGASCFVILMPLYYGVNGVISTDYIMANFFIYFLLAHIKKYRLLQIISAAIMVMTKETAVILLAVFCFAYALLEIAGKDWKKKGELIKEEGINFIPVILWGAIFLTRENSKWLNVTSLLNLKNIVLIMAGLIMAVGLLYFLYCKWEDKVVKCFQFAVVILIITGMITAVFSEKVEAVYGPMEQLNSVGLLGREYLFLRLKNLFALNFQWLYWGIIILFLLTDIFRKGRIWKNKYVISLSLSVLLFVVAHCVYLTYTHPRYFQPIILLVGMYAAILILEYEKKMSMPLLVTVACLSFVQNFIPIDLISRNSYHTVDTGNGTLLTSAYCKKELSYSDANVYNFEYTYLNQVLLKIVKDVEPDKKTLFLMDDVAYPYLKGNRSKYAVWGNLWYSDYGKKVYFDGSNLNSFKEKGDVEIKIKTVNSEKEINLDGYDRVYYLEIPEKTDAENTTEWFKSTYALEEYQSYKVMNWKINTYMVKNGAQ